jgi:hypothetical protein
MLEVYFAVLVMLSNRQKFNIEMFRIIVVHAVLDIEYCGYLSVRSIVTPVN